MQKFARYRLNLAFSALLLFCFGVTPAAVADTVVLVPSQDNGLYDSATGALSNGAGDHFFAGVTGSGGPGLVRGLLAFDVAASVPAGSTINSASLTLFMSRAAILDFAPSRIVTLHRVSTAWGEGTSDAPSGEGGGAPSTANDATWLHTFWNTAFWTTNGGDFVVAASASQTIPKTAGFYSWTGLGSDVQLFLDQPGDDHGWIVIGDETAVSARRFDSRTNPTTANRPMLTIDYDPPNCGNGGLDAGEQCDDGNTDPGDCCDATCQFETGPGMPPCCDLGVCQLGQGCGAVCVTPGTCQLGGASGTDCVCAP